MAPESHDGFSYLPCCPVFDSSMPFESQNRTPRSTATSSLPTFPPSCRPSGTLLLFNCSLSPVFVFLVAHALRRDCRSWRIWSAVIGCACGVRGRALSHASYEGVVGASNPHRYTLAQPAKRAAVQGESHRSQITNFGQLPPKGDIRLAATIFSMRCQVFEAATLSFVLTGT